MLMAQPLPNVEMILSELKEQRLFKDEDTEGSILWYIAYYRKRAPRRRMAFRTCGFVLLFLSITLPFLTAIVPQPRQSVVASTVAWIIALVAAANSFFGWQKAWQLYTKTQLALEFALSEWELRTAEARAAATDQDGVRLLQDALQKLTKTVSESISAETAEYFEGLKMPDVRSPNT